MKKSILLAVLAVAVSTLGFASDNLDDAKGTAKAVITTTSRASVYKLVYNSAKSGLVRVIIKDKTGRVVMEDEIQSQKGFVRPYNFSGMPAGNYNVTVADANGKTELAVAYSNLTASNVRKAEVTALENQKYQLRLVGCTANAVEVTIFDRNNQQIHSEMLTQQGSFIRVYDLSKLKAEGISFEIKTENGLVSRVQL